MERHFRGEAYLNKVIYLVIGIMFLMSSCATILTGTRDMIYFNTNPQGAIVLIDGLEACKTPCSVPVKRSISDELVEFKLDGYKIRLITLDKEFNVVSVLNLFSLFGWAIDVATGSVMKYDRRAYDLDLEKDEKLSLLRPDKIEINTKEKYVDVYVIKRE